MVNGRTLQETVNEYLAFSEDMPSVVPSYQMTTLGKLFFASLITSALTDRPSPFKLSGDRRRIEVLARAVQSSKRFQDEIKRPGATVDSVIRALDLKNVDSRNFERVFGVRFPMG